MLMETLEIVRLELINFGISLLPFTDVGMLSGGLRRPLRPNSRLADHKWQSLVRRPRHEPREDSGIVERGHR